MTIRVNVINYAKNLSSTRRRQEKKGKCPIQEINDGNAATEYQIMSPPAAETISFCVYLHAKEETVERGLGFNFLETRLKTYPRRCLMNGSC